MQATSSQDDEAGLMLIAMSPPARDEIDSGPSSSKNIVVIVEADSGVNILSRWLVMNGARRSKIILQEQQFEGERIGAFCDGRDCGKDLSDRYAEWR
jgi:hypothetical protein